MSPSEEGPEGASLIMYSAKLFITLIFTFHKSVYMCVLSISPSKIKRKLHEDSDFCLVHCDRISSAKISTRYIKSIKYK